MVNAVGGTIIAVLLVTWRHPIPLLLAVGRLCMAPAPLLHLLGMTARERSIGRRALAAERDVCGDECPAVGRAVDPETAVKDAEPVR